MIELSHVTVMRRDKKVLTSVTAKAVAGEVVALIGPNGAGKSTLLQVMAGDLEASAGSVSFAGRELGHWKVLDLARRRSVMSQSTRLGFTLPVVDVVALGRSPFHALKSTAENNQAVEAAMRLAGVDSFADRSYSTLSGGEQQRVQFARALAQIDFTQKDSSALLLDEPTASLDLAYAYHALKVVRSLARQGVAVVAAIHDLSLAYRYADQVIVIQNGRIVASGPPALSMTPEILARTFGIDAAYYEGGLVIRGVADDRRLPEISVSNHAA